MFASFYTDFNVPTTSHNSKIRQSAASSFNPVEIGIEPLFDCPIHVMTSIEKEIKLKFTHRFWSKIKFGESDECWEWKSNFNKFGYGKFQIKDATVGAHRYLFTQLYGELTRWEFVLHTCDNRKCCNPNHLWVGSPKDNMQDMLLKGRKSHAAPKGSGHPKAKLTEANIPIIRNRIKTEEAYPSIAKSYGVSASLIGCIAKGKIWKHVPLT